MVFRLAVVGSRTFRPLQRVDDFLLALALRAGPLEFCIVSGGAKGVDRHAVEAARRMGYPTDVLKPDWEKYGRLAGLLRNTQIVDSCDGLVAFWDGVSRGTRDSVSKAKQAGKLLQIIR